MKTTIDLPAELVRELKLRAIHEGRKLKDVAADVLRTGLAFQPAPPTEEPAVVIKDKKTGLPVIQCRRAAPKGQELTPERVAKKSREHGWVSHSYRYVERSNRAGRSNV